MEIKIDYLTVDTNRMVSQALNKVIHELEVVIKESGALIYPGALQDEKSKEFFDEKLEKAKIEIKIVQRLQYDIIESYWRNKR